MTVCEDTLAPMRRIEHSSTATPTSTSAASWTFIDPCARAGRAGGDRGARAEAEAAARPSSEDRAAQIELLDMCELGRNPGRIIPAVLGMIERHGDRPLRYVGEPIWSGRSPEEVREATRHEALINFAWPDADIRVLCPYDVASLDDQVLARRRAHTSRRRPRRAARTELGVRRRRRSRPDASSRCPVRRRARSQARRSSSATSGGCARGWPDGPPIGGWTRSAPASS